ncbi:hypothetical protein [uncultured Herbaspirillum sp.]|uniref:hypothetical protein n=1 Tax=uncultured Herbaspirillum sp. TaxID=160236 RepID=UPI0026131EF5|nr:hypothetical protein [uncultured Herbaspirillum sp.]
MDFQSAAGWAAAIIIILILLRLQRRWRKGHCIDAGLGWSGAAGPGNRIYLYNLTARAIVVKRWSLHITCGRFRRRRVLEMADASWPSEEIRIEAHGAHVLYFWDAGFLAGEAHRGRRGRLYIKLGILGGRSRTCCLYPIGSALPGYGLGVRCS